MPTGGSKAIAVVEYGTYSNVQSDLNTFSTQFGLPAVTITQLCLPSPPCVSNVGSGWDLEEALDVEYAHAMAPHAQIIIASFANDPIGDGAETAAANAVAAAGGGEVSNSWTYNSGESWCGSGNCELQYDQYFNVKTVVFFGSAGDSGLGVAYPSISPNVISAGGTYIQRDSSGNFSTETCWNAAAAASASMSLCPTTSSSLGTGLERTGAPPIGLPLHRRHPALTSTAQPIAADGVRSVAHANSPVLAGITNAAGTSTPQVRATSIQPTGATRIRACIVITSLT